MVNSGNNIENIAGDDLEGQAGHLLRRVFHKARNTMQKKISNLGLTPMQTAALTSLRQRGPTSQNKLGRRLGMEPGNVHGLVDRLLKKKLISSHRVEEGAGLHILDLTSEGEAVVDKVIPLGIEANNEMMTPLSRVEQKRFLEYLRRLL